MLGCWPILPFWGYIGMEIYNVIFNDDDKGVFGISLVEDPAIEAHFITLSKESKKIELAEVNKEQRILLGATLIPEKPIYRKEGEREFQIVFSKDTIKKAAHEFLKNQYNTNSSLEHDKKIEDVAVVESWIVEGENDKSKSYGLDVPAGSWVTMMKIYNDEIWDQYVKTGAVTGFSIDGLFSLEKTKTELNKHKNMDKVLEALANITNMLKKPTIELSTAKFGELEVSFEGEEIKVNTALFIKDEEGKDSPLVDGEYTQDKQIFVVVNGIVTEIKEVVVEDSKEVLEAELTKVKAELSALKTEDKTKELLVELGKLKAELSSTPATTPKKKLDKEETFDNTPKGKIKAILAKHRK